MKAHCMRQPSGASAGCKTSTHLMVIKGVDEDAQIVRPVKHGPADHICKDVPREICTALLMLSMQEHAMHCSAVCGSPTEPKHCTTTLAEDFTCVHIMHKENEIQQVVRN